MTAEEISQTYTWHIIINRWGAALIDFIILFLIWWVPYQYIDARYYEILNAISLAIICLYFPVWEGFWGLTLGKLITRIKVVDNDFTPPGFTRALIRTVFRLLEVNPLLFGGVPAGVLVLSSNTRQRLGDRLAHTYVLRVRDIEEAKKEQSNIEGAES